MHRRLALAPGLYSIVLRGGARAAASMRDACQLHRYVEGQVGKDFMVRLRAAAQAASK
jgi:hypothetical protein